MAGEMKTLLLDAVLVDGGRHQDIIKPLTVVGHRSLQTLQGSLSCLLAALSELYAGLLVADGKEVDASGACFRSLLDDGVVNLDAQGLAVVGHGLGIAIEDGGTQFKHEGFGQGLQDDLVAHSVGVACRDGHSGQFRLRCHILCGHSVFDDLRLIQF